MIISNVLANLNYKIIKADNNKQINIENIFIDNRKITNNSMFVCIKGTKVNGHSFIEKAIKSGAVCIVVDEAIEKNRLNSFKNVVVIEVENSRAALSIIAKNFYNNCVDKMKIIGFTGTNGKTSSTFFLAQILSKCTRFYTKIGIIGTSGVLVDGEKLDINFSTSTTPDTLELHNIFEIMYNLNVTHVIMEVSSHALALKKVEGINFEIGVFTNLTQDHLDFHKTFHHYSYSKSKLFKQCNISIINFDDPNYQLMVKQKKNKLVSFQLNKTNKSNYTYNNNLDENYFINNLNIDKSGSSFSLTVEECEYDFKMKLLGLFNVYNVVGAIFSAYYLGMDMEDIVDSVYNLVGVSGRFENIVNNRNITCIVDYAHSPDSLENIIKSVALFTKGSIITVFGAGGDRDKTKRPQMGLIASKLSNICIITSDNPRNENPETIIEEIYSGININELQNTTIYKITDRKEAIKKAVSLANQNDTIIIAGKGAEDYQEFKNGYKIYFDDKVIALQIMNNKI